MLDEKGLAMLDATTYMQLALEEAERAAECGEVPVGAVLVMGDQIFRGHNRMIMDSDPSAHAEVVVMRAAAHETGNYRLLGGVLYVTLEPCIMCTGTIVQARIERLVYGASDPRYGAVESMLKTFEFGVNHKPEIEGGVLGEEAGRILKQFFKARR